MTGTPSGAPAPSSTLLAPQPAPFLNGATIGAFADPQAVDLTDIVAISPTATPLALAGLLEWRLRALVELIFLVGEGPSSEQTRLSDALHPMAEELLNVATALNSRLTAVVRAAA